MTVDRARRALLLSGAALPFAGCARTEASYDGQWIGAQHERGHQMRDRKSGTPLYEARATNGSLSRPTPDVFAAMFQAALKDFPNAVPQPHRVAVQLGNGSSPK